jgi:hypothetical protein
MGGVTRAFIYGIAVGFFLLGVMTGVFISVLVTSTHARADGTTMAPLSDIHPPVAHEPGPQWKLTVTVTDTEGKPVNKLRYTGRTWDTRDYCQKFVATDDFSKSLPPLVNFMIQQGYEAYTVDFACEPMVDRGR